jgi:dTDP-4-dehydrorhamnose reductase
MTLRILLAGATGQVGRALAGLLPHLGDVTALDRQHFDLAKPEQLRDVIRSLCPELIVNAAAHTGVDRAESEEGIAQAVNADAPRVIADEAKKVGAALVHYSTDYIFDGTKRTPYVEDDPPHPQNAYGRTKLAAERAITESGVPHLIFRTAWVYDREGRNFLRTILRLATQREELRVVQDQTGAPTWSCEIALASLQILKRMYAEGNTLESFAEFGGTYHMTAAGETSWYGFAKVIMEEASHCSLDRDWFAAATERHPLITRRIIPISTDEYPTPACRPAYSVLSNARLAERFGVDLPDWRTQLREVFAGGRPQTDLVGFQLRRRD